MMSLTVILMADKIIVDIDGTLSDPNHRRHHVEGDNNDWEKFFEKVDDDGLKDWCREIIDRFKYDYNILLVTGRPERSIDGVDVKQKTIDWLEAYGVHWDRLVMRKAGDVRKDTVVKQEMLDEDLPDPDDVLFALDDREDIAEMWRENGIVCLRTEDEVRY